MAGADERRCVYSEVPSGSLTVPGGPVGQAQRVGSETPTAVMSTAVADAKPLPQSTVVSLPPPSTINVETPTPECPKVPHFGPIKRSLDTEAITTLNIIFFASVAYMILLALDDLRDTGRVTLVNWEAVGRCFTAETMLIVSLLWLFCNGLLVIAYWGLQCWRGGRASLRKSSFGQRVNEAVWLWDRGFCFAALLLNVLMVVPPTWAAWYWDIAMSAKCALSFEQVRLMMKMYSYLFEHAQSAVAQPPRHSNNDFSHMVYYLFAPTLIYKDSYERNAKVRWTAIVRHFLMFFVVVFSMLVVVGRSTLRPFCGGADVALLELGDLHGLVRFLYQYSVVTLRCLPAAGILVMGGSIAMHSWHKVFAELLRYKAFHAYSLPWWNAPSYEVYFRRWNPFVKAWLQKYVHEELVKKGSNITVSKLACISISAVWHEYIISVSVGFITPCFTIVYIFGACYALTDPFGIQKNKMRGNFFLLSTISLGASLMIAYYFLEANARGSCTSKTAMPWSLFVPYTLTCDNPRTTCSNFV